MKKKAGTRAAAALLALLLALTLPLCGCTGEGDGTEVEQTGAPTAPASGDGTSAEDPDAFTITMTDAEVSSSDEMFSVDIVMKNNPGVAILMLSVSTDDDLTVIGSLNGDGFFSDLDTGYPASGYNLIFSSNSNVTGDGVIATLTLNCAGAAKGSHTLTLRYHDGCDENAAVVAPAGAGKNDVIATSTLTVR